MRDLVLLLFCSHLAACTFTAESLAYAPNFITKIIQAETGIKPVGLLSTDADSPSKEVDDKENDENDENESGKRAISMVKTRFPPEPNGYLHLGHAKAVSFNFAVARMFGGVCHMRLDDTNPSKEDKEYVDSILEDVRWIQDGLYDPSAGDPWDGPVRKTSGYFDEIYECAVALIKSGDAYVDSLTAEEMKEYRGTLTEPGKDSPFRTRTVKENLKLFQDMKNGDCSEGEHVLRAKIDMSSPNVNMRDPTLYRIKHESHQETGDQWCIYPMYDFSHPISDALEGITHSLCTLEFEDHRPFYDWTIERLLPTGLIAAQPRQIEFSRLNVQSTVLSKRKLIQLVQSGFVSGWDDPRMPTLSGFRRRGVPPAALRLFCERVGISKAESNIDLKILEDCVRETMDASCPRAFAVLQPLRVKITNWNDGIENFEAERHPKKPEMGNRTIPFSGDLFIERSDFFDTEGPEGKISNGKPPKGFKRLVPNDKVRLRYAYVIECNKIVRDPETQEPLELQCTYNPETRAGYTPEGMKRVNGIIHWLEATSAIRCTVNHYDRLFSTEYPGRESDDYLNDLNSESLEIFKGAVVEPRVAMDALFTLAATNRRELPQGATIYPSSLAYQFERMGYFALDKDASTESLIFNRVVSLRDTWGVPKEAETQTRGGGEKEFGRQQSNEGEAVEDILRASLRAATILSVAAHPEAESLLVCQVDCGDKTEDGEVAPRTVVSGLAGKFSMEDLVGQKVVTVTNLKPARMRGIESTAMLLVASKTEDGGSKVELLHLAPSVPNGELLRFDGMSDPRPDAMLKSKGALKAWERAKAGLRTSTEGIVEYWNGEVGHSLVSSAGQVRVHALVHASIE